MFKNVFKIVAEGLFVITVIYRKIFE